MNSNSNQTSWAHPIEQCTSNTFDPVDFDDIRQLTILSVLSPQGEKCTNLSITAYYKINYVVTFNIQNARSLQFEQAGDSCMQFGELFIDKLGKHGLESVNYRLYDTIGSFSCYCDELQVSQIHKVIEEKNEVLLWSRE